MQTARILVFVEGNDDGFWLFRTGGDQDRKFNCWESELPHEYLERVGAISDLWGHCCWITVDATDNIMSVEYVGAQLEILTEENPDQKTAVLAVPEGNHTRVAFCVPSGRMSYSFYPDEPFAGYWIYHNTDGTVIGLGGVELRRTIKREVLAILRLVRQTEDTSLGWAPEGAVGFMIRFEDSRMLKQAPVRDYADRLDIA